MKLLVILSVLFKFFCLLLLVTQFILKNKENQIIKKEEQYINYASLIIGISTLIFPRFLASHIILILQASYMIYVEFTAKQNQMKNIGQNEAKEGFMTVFIFFSALLTDGKFHKDLFLSIYQRIKYFVIDTFSIMFALMSLILIISDIVLERNEEMKKKNKRNKNGKVKEKTD